MTNITKFRFPDRKPTDDLLTRDQIPPSLNPGARLIYLRIISESPPGVLLQCDRLMVEMAARSTDQALTSDPRDGDIESLRDTYERIMLADLGEEYIAQVLAKR